MDKPAEAGVAPGVLLLTGISALSFFLFGYDTGVVSGAFAWVRDELQLSGLAYETLVGSTTLAAALGALAAASLNEARGRKVPIMVASALFFAGDGLSALLPARGLGLGASFGFGVLLLGRILVGLGIGVATVTVPMYISEAAPPEQRGFLLVLNDLSVVTGQFVAGLVNVGMEAAGRQWRVSIGLALLPGVAQLVGFAFLPESPRWLCQHGRRDEARDVLRRLRPSEAAVDAELRAISAEVEVIQVERRDLGLAPTGGSVEGGGRRARLADLAVYWRHGPVRRAMTLGVVLMAMNQFAGINTVMYYSVDMMEMAGFNPRASVLIACACDLAQLLGVCYSLWRMDIDGRRHLALQSTSLVMPTLFMLSLAFWLHSGGLAVVALILYLPAFGSGLSGVPWTVNSEIYPLSVRSLAVSQATACNWFFNSIVSFSFVSLSTALGPGNTFLVYLGCCVVGGLWLYARMPETKGLGLEEVAQLFETPHETDLSFARLCRKMRGERAGYEPVEIISEEEELSG